MAQKPATGQRARRQFTCSGSYLERGMGGENHHWRRSFMFSARGINKNPLQYAQPSN